VKKTNLLFSYSLDRSVMLAAQGAVQCSRWRRTRRQEIAAGPRRADNGPVGSSPPSFTVSQSGIICRRLLQRQKHLLPSPPLLFLSLSFSLCCCWLRIHPGNGRRACALMTSGGETRRDGLRMRGSVTAADVTWRLSTGT